MKGVNGLISEVFEDFTHEDFCRNEVGGGTGGSDCQDWEDDDALFHVCLDEIEGARVPDWLCLGG